MNVTARDMIASGAEYDAFTETLVEAARKLRDLDVQALPICVPDESCTE